MNIKYQWEENIKPLILFIIVGMAIVVGMRIMEAAWPETKPKLFICVADDLGKVSACKDFEK